MRQLMYIFQGNLQTQFKDTFSHVTDRHQCVIPVPFFHFFICRFFGMFRWYYYFLIQISIVWGLFKSTSLFNTLLTWPSLCFLPDPRIGGIIFKYWILFVSMVCAAQFSMWHQLILLFKKCFFMTQGYQRKTFNPVFNIYLLSSLEER